MLDGLLHESSKPILVLAPHTDDGELGCGGLINRLIRNNFDVHYYAFCCCDESLPDQYPKGTLRSEVHQALKCLGVNNDNISTDDFKVRYLSYERQKVLDILVNINRDLDPSIIFCPSLDDLHQDHQTVAYEALRAFKMKTILAYEMPWNNLSFNANFIASLTRDDVAAKAKSLSMYESQSSKTYMSENYIFSLAHSRGVSVGKEYAEAFTLLRAVL